MTDRASDAYVINESPTRMDGAELRASIQNIIATEGVKPQYAMCATDSSSAYLPSVELSSDDKVVVQKKLAEAKLSKLDPSAPQSQSVELDGGMRGLVDRADSNNDNRLSREEITARMGTKLGQQEAMALKDIYRNFSAIDTNDNGLISRSDIQNSQDRARSRQQMEQHLDAFRSVVARHRNTIDRNHDGQFSAQELATAGQSNSGINEKERAEINWIRGRR